MTTFIILYLATDTMKTDKLRTMPTFQTHAYKLLG